MINVVVNKYDEKSLINGNFHYQLKHSRTTSCLGGIDELEWECVMKLNHKEVNDLYEQLTNIRQAVLDAKATEKMRPKVFSKD